jgi:exopolyphosphatase/guanosine-5'-triphosphate,3'-diphosphate pyrophosphatase
MPVVACIDIGTVSVRLVVADVEAGRVVRSAKTTRICDLGEGVAHTGMLSTAACERVVSCVHDYVSSARGSGAASICCTLTSAARDASNAPVLLSSLSAEGVEPEVIPGSTEGTLTFLGVAQDFPGERIVVADNGGGSTELAVGTLVEGGPRLDWVRSLDVGCRRVTELFLSNDDPPLGRDVVRARAFAGKTFAQAIASPGCPIAPDGPTTCRLVVVGGTATTLIAIDQALDPYDSSKVHLHALSHGRVDELADTMARLSLEERCGLVGLQTKRAPVILAGTLIISELMAAGGFKRFQASESDLLVGLSLVAANALEGESPLIPWQPRLVPLG